MITLCFIKICWMMRYKMKDENATAVEKSLNIQKIEAAEARVRMAATVPTSDFVTLDASSE